MLVTWWVQITLMSDIAYIQGSKLPKVTLALGFKQVCGLLHSLVFSLQSHPPSTAPKGSRGGDKWTFTLCTLRWRWQQSPHPAAIFWGELGLAPTGAFENLAPQHQWAFQHISCLQLMSWLPTLTGQSYAALIFPVQLGLLFWLCPQACPLVGVCEGWGCERRSHSRNARITA